MVSAAMNVFLSFIAALATSDSRSAFMCLTVSTLSRILFYNSNLGKEIWK